MNSGHPSNKTETALALVLGFGELGEFSGAANLVKEVAEAGKGVNLRDCYPFLPERLYLPPANSRDSERLDVGAAFVDPSALDRVVSRKCADAPYRSHLVFVPSRSFCRRSDGDCGHLPYYDLRP